MASSVSGCVAKSRADDLIHPRAEMAFGDLARIELTHRAGCGVSRIGKRRLAGRLALLIDAVELRPRKVDFAAHLERAGRRPPQT